VSSEIRTDVDTIVDRVHRIGREIVEPAAAEVDRAARFPTESFAALRAEKLLSAYVPVQYGGMGLYLLAAILTITSAVSYFRKHGHAVLE